jgi:phage gpG-like protein
MAIIQLSGLDRIMDRLRTNERKLGNLHVPFTRAALVIYADVKQRFASSGPGWAPVQRGGQPLRLTGRLMASITSKGAGSVYQETPNSLEVGTNVRYANVHQFGFSGVQQVGSHSRNQTHAFGRAMAPRRVTVAAHSRRMRITARPFLVSNTLKGDIIQVFKDYMKESKS